MTGPTTRQTVDRVRKDLLRAWGARDEPDDGDQDLLPRLLLAAYPDRVAKRSSATSNRVSLGDGTSAEGRTCTTTCGRDASCPSGGRCLALAGDPSGTFLCFAPCETSMDCFEGHACTETTGGDGSKICLPQ